MFHPSGKFPMVTWIYVIRPRGHCMKSSSPFHRSTEIERLTSTGCLDTRSLSSTVLNCLRMLMKFANTWNNLSFLIDHLQIASIWMLFSSNVTNCGPIDPSLFSHPSGNFPVQPGHRIYDVNLFIVPLYVCQPFSKSQLKSIFPN